MRVTQATAHLGKPIQYFQLAGNYNPDNGEEYLVPYITIYTGEVVVQFEVYHNEEDDVRGVLYEAIIRYLRDREYYYRNWAKNLS